MNDMNETESISLNFSKLEARGEIARNPQPEAQTLPKASTPTRNPALYSKETPNPGVPGSRRAPQAQLVGCAFHGERREQSGGAMKAAAAATAAAAIAASPAPRRNEIDQRWDGTLQMNKRLELAIGVR